MSDIFIDASHFAQADQLCEIISSRKLTVKTQETIAADAAGGCLVFSTARETAMGGRQALIAFARSLKPKLVTIIDPTANHFAIESSLGGKVIHICLPSDDRFALTVAADSLLIESGVV